MSKSNIRENFVIACGLALVAAVVVAEYLRGAL